MSCPITKAKRSKAKDARQSPPPEPPRWPSKTKRPKLWTIEHRRSCYQDDQKMSDWYVTGRYHSEKVRDTALEGILRKREGFKGLRWRVEYRAGPPPKENSMKLYRTITSTADPKEAWAGSQAEAASQRKAFNQSGVRRDDIVTVEVDVPTDKKGLLEFLNKRGGNVA